MRPGLPFSPAGVFRYAELPHISFQLTSVIDFETVLFDAGQGLEDRDPPGTPLCLVFRPLLVPVYALASPGFIDFKGIP